ncbi:helix-turn-helix transcriptional regulator [Acinetobacter modestus]|uniref:helix-turn-helix domain-containing protein n=1 Tax=Acinetobacter modestus TaxID=1776740 RepID=UPI0020309EFC|nr:helix-turn-helix transcriptional regulator [Acinetobacter modestus]MCM1958156.1 helix-turn-helix transcriptional regulator [Acinetobacter modestus]
MTPLRRIREIHKYSLAEVAAAVSSDAGNLSRIENGNQKPSLQLAEDLTHFFKGEITEMQLLYPERFDVAAPKEFDDLSKEKEQSQ